jgi:hypothetical protein
MAILDRIVRGEYAENTLRKTFTPSEVVAVTKAIGRAALSSKPLGPPRSSSRSSLPSRVVRSFARDRKAGAGGLHSRTSEYILYRFVGRWRE